LPDGFGGAGRLAGLTGATHGGIPFGQSERRQDAALAQIVSANVTTRFHRPMGNRRDDVGRGTRVYCGSTTYKRQPGYSVAGSGTWLALQSLRRPLVGLRSLGRRVFETTPGRFNFGLCGPVASRPCLGGGHGVLGDVVTNDRAGCPTN
jgi:hypothetical protein